MSFAALVRRTQQLIVRRYEEIGGPLPPVPQVAVLAALLVDGPLTHRKITEATSVDRSTLATMLSAMRAAGLVTIAIPQTDTRCRLVTITPSGCEILARATNALTAAEKDVLGRVPRAQRKPLLAALTYLVQVQE